MTGPGHPPAPHRGQKGTDKTVVPKPCHKPTGKPWGWIARQTREHTSVTTAGELGIPGQPGLHPGERKASLGLCSHTLAQNKNLGMGGTTLGVGDFQRDLVNGHNSEPLWGSEKTGTMLMWVQV